MHDHMCVCVRAYVCIYPSFIYKETKKIKYTKRYSVFIDYGVSIFFLIGLDFMTGTFEHITFRMTSQFKLRGKAFSTKFDMECSLSQLEILVVLSCFCRFWALVQVNSKPGEW